MPKLKREFFDGKSKFVPNTSSNYSDGRYKKDEWRIERHWKTPTFLHGKPLGVLDTSQRFCDFFGSRKEALLVCKALELVPILKRKLAKLKGDHKSTLDNYRETFTQLAHSEEKRTKVEAELKEKTTIVDALMIELRSQKVDMQRGFDQLIKVWTEKDAGRVRRIDELEASVASLTAINSAHSSDNRELNRRAVAAEALVGRIVIKRDRRSR